QVIPWNTTDQPELPVAPPATATPTLWLLPPDLMAKAAPGQSGSKFALEQRLPQSAPHDAPAALSSYAWAMLIRVAVRRIPGLPGTVEVLGADAADRQRLAQLLDYLGAVAGLPTQGAF